MLEKSIGIIGGVGPAAGLALMRAVHQFAKPANDQAYPNVILASFGAQIPDRTGYLLGEHNQNPAGPIASVLNALGAAGASVVGIPCNTAHSPKIWSKICTHLDENGHRPELVNMVASTFNEVLQVGNVQRVGVLATSGSVNSNVFGIYGRRLGFEVVYPTPSQQATLHDAIYDPEYGIKSTVEQYTDRCIADCAEVGRQLLPDVDCLLIGCTELSLIPKSTFAELSYPAFHSLDALAKQLLKGL
ncbi:MAG: aspartate/glutamate racemase family protein [Pseudomonadales bacterium]